MSKQRNIMRIVVLCITIALVAACLSVCLVACGDTGEQNKPTPEPTKFTLSFYADETVYHTISTSGNESITLPTNPTKDGFDFDGWYFDKDEWLRPLTVSTFVEEALNSDMRVYAKWTQRGYDVKFMDGDTLWKTVFVAENECVAEPTENPEKLGYEFVEWIDKDGEPWDFDIEIDEDIDLYASWQIKSYTVTASGMDELGGTVSGGGTYEFNSQVTISATLNEGYAFDGWYKNGQKVSAETTYTFTLGANDESYVSKWSYTKRQVEFNSRGGTSVAPMLVNNGDKLTAPKQPQRNGYLFAGWYKDEDVTILWDFDNDSVYQNFTLFAKWEQRINFISDNIVWKTVILDENEKIAIPDDYPEKTGHEFIEWRDKNGVPWDFNIKAIGNLDLFAHWNINVYTIFAIGSDDLGGTIIGGGEYEYGSNITLSIILNDGYQFDGWYKDNIKVGDDLKYTFSVGTQNETYVAKWTYIKCLVQFDSNNGTAIESILVNIGDTLDMPQQPVKQGYLFDGWYMDIAFNKPWNFTSDIVTEKLILYAKWSTFTITTNTNMPEAGEFTNKNEEITLIGASVTLTAHTNSGYMWLGWFDENEKVSTNNSLTLTFEMPSENKIFTAKWMICPIILEKNIDEAGEVNGVEKTILGDTTTITAVTNIGYTWLGWFDGETKISDSTSNSYTFTMSSSPKTYTAKWIICPITLDKNLDAAGSVSGNEITTLNTETTITAHTNPGYIWLGWYDGETKISSEDCSSYKFLLSNEPKTFIAKWSKLTLSQNIKNAGTISNLNQTYVEGQEITISAIPNAGYVFSGWYDGSNLLSEDKNYTFPMPHDSKTFVAKFTQHLNHIYNNTSFDKNYHYCTVCHYSSSHSYDGISNCTVCDGTVGAYYRLNNSVYFGTYPQSRITNTSIISTLNTLVEPLPTSDNKQNWTSYNYYISNIVKNYMWYIDIYYLGEKYRGVYFTSYRPYYCDAASNSEQSNNGYSTNVVYWFRWEPIQWKILTEKNYQAFLLCETAIDSQQFSCFSNTYANSDIRSWLNFDFYNTVFSNLQKNIIQTTNVDNSASSTGYSSNRFACDNTKDKVFLLSYLEATSYNFTNSSRLKKCTEYAKSQGCWVDNNYVSWWLRSPYNHSTMSKARRVYTDGTFNDGKFSITIPYMDNTAYGIVPALWIKL